MKVKLGHIAIGLFVVINTAFDLINIEKSVFLSVMFFVGLYGSFLIICIYNYIKDFYQINYLEAKIKGDLYWLIMGIGFAVRIIWEIYKGIEYWMDYEAYMLSVNSYEKGLLFTFFMIALMLIAVQNGRNNRNCE